MPDFYSRTGKMALGSRLRRLSDRITDEAAAIYQLYGNDFQPRWFPVFYVLSEQDGRTITEIASEIGHSHVSVSQIVKDLARNGYLEERAVSGDRRKNHVFLSELGRATAVRLQEQFRDVNDALEAAMAETSYNLWGAIAEWEHLLERKPLLRRVQELKKARESAEVQVVDYQPEYAAAFRALNEEWISKYFRMEAADYAALDHPDEKILQPGGHIFVALYGGEAVGVCALLKHTDGTWELAKMAVSPKAQGKNIGWLLGRRVIEKARELGATALFLESNTMLKPAVNLYYKLGFRKITGRPSPYERSNIQMELEL
ncbi:bifunctional helix-turn-helix transcriptional regulator/GNAT family N-acetyltransferase [Flaviaesturariibacter amylovorans]|uniref:GNAT family N-acetyltransferase n=1 Tax=Flaviaesturariibacter amylovorans TaxID=1084520 RepID=A0ABP8GVL0_9BACT